MYHLAEGGFLITRFFRKVSQAKKYNYSVHDIVCTRETRFCVIIPREKYLCFFQRPPQAEKWCLPAAGERLLMFSNTQMKMSFEIGHIFFPKLDNISLFSPQIKI